MFRFPNTAIILRKWVPRIGRTAARWFVVAVWARVLMLRLGILLFVALALTARWAGPFVIALATFVSVVAFGNATLIWLGALMARRAASHALRIKVTLKNYPPNDEGPYLDWCQRNGLVPNEAAKGDGWSRH